MLMVAITRSWPTFDNSDLNVGVCRVLLGLLSEAVKHQVTGLVIAAMKIRFFLRGGKKMCEAGKTHTKCTRSSE